MTSPLQRVAGQSGLLTTGAGSVFDLAPGWAQQNMTFKFYLIEQSTGRILRELHPTASQTPTLSHDVTRTVKRQLQATFIPADVAVIDPLSNRVRIAMVLGDGSTFPLGKYVFTDQSNTRFTSGVYGVSTLMDEEFIMDQPLSTSFPTPQYSALIFNVNATNVPAPTADHLAVGVMTNYPTISYVFDSSPYTTSATWGFGTSGMQVLTDLATFGDFFAPWIGNDEMLHMIRTFDPAQKIPDINWDRYPHVIADTITETTDVISAPNRYIVVSNGQSSSFDSTSGNPQSIVGTYDVPASAPYSIQSRGFIIPQIAQLQLDTPLQANAVARTLGIQSTIYNRTTLTTFPDPRHDSHTVVWWQGFPWLELAWSMELQNGGKMTHTLRRVYS